MTVVVTGGAGFIGANLVDRHLNRGRDVLILDNLSRPGSGKNVAWLKQRHGERVRVFQESVTDFAACQRAMQSAETVYHLAAQTAVTTSVTDPRQDFEVNALGTLNLLEASRHSSDKPKMIFASTNKVYGALDEIPSIELESRHEFVDLPFGVSERQPLDFHSPYGCSKGAADQYVRDYSRIYDLRTAVFRQSCIYGPRQMGVEDQGWLAWFVIALVTGQPITIFGNGKQMRDVLFIDDLLDAFDAIERRLDKHSGEIFNIGGGPDNAISVWWEFLPLVEEALQREVPAPSFAPERPGDQPVYVSDIRKAASLLDWQPTVGPAEGIQRLTSWVQENRTMFG